MNLLNHPYKYFGLCHVQGMRTILHAGKFKNCEDVLQKLNQCNLAADGHTVYRER